MCRATRWVLPLYQDLLDLHDYQGWWPIVAYDGTNPTHTGSLQGYHPRIYSVPRNDRERFEISAGAILTRSTAWHGAEQAVVRLHEGQLLTADSILDADPDRLKDLIRPAGYFNQKAKTLMAFATFYQALGGKTPTRQDLLTVRGIGKETADTILLYAYGVPTFVVDAYTRRIFGHLGLINPEDPYDTIQRCFETALPSDASLFQEYHALIVEHAKHYYQRRQKVAACPLLPKYRSLIPCMQSNGSQTPGS